MTTQTTTQNEKMVNGVSVTRLFETVDAIKQMPAVADFRFRAENHWIGGGHNRTEIKPFHGAMEDHAHTHGVFVLDNDEPPLLLGEDHGANPVEHLLNALAGCVTTSLVYHAAARGITVRAVRSRLEGDIDLHGFLGLREDVTPGYKQIRMTFDVDADASDDEVKELLELAQKRSPVFNSVKRGVEMKVDLER